MCDHFQKEDVTIDLIKRCIKEKGVVFLRTYQDCEHYVIVTDIDDDNAYLFDSYYLEQNH
jgi:hypothetical protein